MRKTLFRKNYALLKRFIPELMKPQSPAFSLLHEGQLDPLVRTYAERVGDNLIKVGTDWPYRGELLCDPQLVVLFDNDRKMARVTAWTMENITFQLMNGGAIVDCYSCTMDSEEIGREREANSFFHDWLDDIMRGEPLAPDYFQKLPV